MSPQQLPNCDVPRSIASCPRPHLCSTNLTRPRPTFSLIKTHYINVNIVLSTAVVNNALNPPQRNPSMYLLRLSKFSTINKYLTLGCRYLILSKLISRTKNMSWFKFSFSIQHSATILVLPGGWLARQLAEAETSDHTGVHTW